MSAISKISSRSEKRDESKERTFKLDRFAPYNMDDEKEVKKVETTVLAPHIRKHAEVLLANPFLGLCRKELEILNPKPSVFSHDDNSNCDRFHMIIPYAGVKVECMVVFQASAPEVPPDFLFSDSRFFAPLNQMESLRTWDVRKPYALFNVMKEMMQFYKKKQIQELDRYEHLSFEYLCLFQLQNFNEEDIEIIVPSDLESPVIFLIRLHVDFCSLFPEFYRDEDDDKDYPLLLVFFSNRESGKSCQRLYLSKKTKSILNVDESFHLPDDVRENYLPRYIIALEEELKTKMQFAASRFERKKSYFMKFLSHFTGCVLEYDIASCASLTLLLHVKEFYFMLEISLPDDFPLGTPALVFRSIYHYYKGAPYSVSIDNYPYCPTWSLQKVLTETLKFVEDYAPVFQQDSATFGTLAA